MAPFRSGLIPLIVCIFWIFSLSLATSFLKRRYDDQITALVKIKEANQVSYKEFMDAHVMVGTGVKDHISKLRTLRKHRVMSSTPSPAPPPPPPHARAYVEIPLNPERELIENKISMEQSLSEIQEALDECATSIGHIDALHMETLHDKLSFIHSRWNVWFEPSTNRAIVPKSKFSFNATVHKNTKIGLQRFRN